jgi:hypothetical protein
VMATIVAIKTPIVTINPTVTTAEIIIIVEDVVVEVRTVPKVRL